MRYIGGEIYDKVRYIRGEIYDKGTNAVVVNEKVKNYTAIEDTGLDVLPL